MNPENCQTILERIRKAGKQLEGKLPPHPRHPKGRNPYAHIPKVIKSMLGCSYKDAPDETLDVILEIIDHCENHPF